MFASISLGISLIAGLLTILPEYLVVIVQLCRKNADCMELGKKVVARSQQQQFVTQQNQEKGKQRARQLLCNSAQAV